MLQVTQKVKTLFDIEFNSEAALVNYVGLYVREEVRGDEAG
jgi:hypothetical protein